MKGISKVVPAAKKAAVAVTGVAALAAATASMAALDVGVTTEVTNMKADMVEAGGLIIGAAVVAMGIRWVKATFF